MMKYLALIVFAALAVGIQAEHTRVRRDLRDTLVQNAHELVWSLEQAIKLVKELNMTREAETLEKDEADLKELVAQLLAVEPGHKHHHELVVLENKLTKLEAKVSHQLQVLQRSPEIIRQEILDNFGNFSAFVEEQARGVEERGFKAFADEVRADVKSMEVLVEQLEAATKHEDIVKLDKEIYEKSKHVSTKLELLHRDLSVFRILLNSTETLAQEVEQFYEELNKRNLTDAAELLRVDVAELNLVREQLKQEKSIFVFDYLVEKLMELEHELHRKLVELKRYIDSPEELVVLETKAFAAKTEEKLENSLDEH